MKWLLLLLSVTALILAPGLSLAQSKTEPKGGVTFMKDSWITTKTKSKLIANGRVKARHITVETQKGVVTLLGKVDSAEERALAERIAKGVDGVKGVRNVLEIVPGRARKAVNAKDDDIEKAVAERLKKEEPLKESDIKVRSDNGVVTLSGKAPDAKVKTHAADLARRVPGVKMVRNELE
jgi:hyperosmotically inducible protein